MVAPAKGAQVTARAKARDLDRLLVGLGVHARSISVTEHAQLSVLLDVQDVDKLVDEVTNLEWAAQPDWCD